MRRRHLLPVLCALALAVVSQAGASEVISKHYTFSFSVALKPYATQKLPAVKVTGSGSGSFSLAERRIDRDNTVYWTLKDVQGTMSLATGGKTFVSATVVDGSYGAETVYGKVTRNALLRLRITSSTRFHCKPPDAVLGLEDGQTTAGLGFFACVLPQGCTTCAPSLSWQGKAPALVVTVKPA
jgi:hypothetical protein